MATRLQYTRRYSAQIPKRQYTERKPKKKYLLGCDVDKEEIFNYPYLTNENTIAFIKKHGKIMFIIRGPNSTMKATLSEMIVNLYPGTQHCCADHYFSKTFSAPERTKGTLKLSHDYCQKKVEAACIKHESPIIVQNTHMRKWEVQKYLDMAASHNYTVLMAITLYKFDVTPEALDRTSTDGLNVDYFRQRLRQWQDIPPLFTGLFICPDDATFILKSLQTTLSALLGDACFCRVFDVYDAERIQDYFVARRNLYCILGHSYQKYSMVQYYLSDLVQDCYGKSYNITIQAYIVTLTTIMGIIHVGDEIKSLIFEDTASKDEDIIASFSELDVNNNISEYKTTVAFDENSASNKTTAEEECTNEDIDFSNCKLIHLAQRKFENFDIIEVGKEIFKSLPLDDHMEYIELEERVDVCRLPQNMWLIKLPKAIKVDTIFTGLYV